MPNKLFNTQNGFGAEMLDYMELNNGKLPDHVFNQARGEFGFEEYEALEILNEDIGFVIKRISDGWELIP